MSRRAFVRDSEMDTICLFVVFIGSNALILRTAAGSTVKWTDANYSRVHIGSNELKIYCYESKLESSLFSVWTTAQFSVEVLDGSEASYSLYTGPDAASVLYQRNNEGWLVNVWSVLKPWTSTGWVYVDPFNTTCLGVGGAGADYKIKLTIKGVDYLRLACTVAGLILFFVAPQLSGNIICYYSTGISFGVLASALIIVFILSKFIPKKTGAYLFITAGFSFSAYILQTLWSHATEILKEHYHYVCLYFVLAGLISFAVCYYKGPVTNPRLLSLIQWTLQLVALGLIYAGCQITAVSATLIVLCLIQYNLSSSWIGGRVNNKLGAWWRRLFPPKIRLLTEEEYREQARIETEKALNELKSYCNSPKCDTWKTMTRLKSPERFAGWVSGSSFHVTDDEQLEHDLDPQPSRTLDDQFDPDDMGDDFYDDRMNQSHTGTSGLGNSRYGSVSHSNYASPSNSGRYGSGSNYASPSGRYGSPSGLGNSRHGSPGIRSNSRQGSPGNRGSPAGSRSSSRSSTVSMATSSQQANRSFDSVRKYSSSASTADNRYPRYR